MTTYRIVCTTLMYPTAHRHIVSVGTGEPSKANRQWTVAQVRTAMANGDVFYTADSHGKVARVTQYTCGCGYQTIRSAADATTANNLDNLRACTF